MNNDNVSSKQEEN